VSTIKSNCWFSEHEVKFKLETGIYQNIIEFLIVNKISFLADMNLDFTIIPFNLHGKGNSKNLLDYISKNSENVILIKSFFEYFIIQIAKIKYDTGKLIKFNFNLTESWENMQISIYSQLSSPIEPNWNYVGILQVGHIESEGTNIYGYSMNEFMNFGNLTPPIPGDYDSIGIVWVDSVSQIGINTYQLGSLYPPFDDTANIEYIEIDETRFNILWTGNEWAANSETNPFPPIGSSCNIKIKYGI
jgi:hypothetical protein